eukprot:6058125-Alexandrium_andersonii.AAC.1
MVSGRVPLCLARYGVPPAMKASWGVAFWAEGCERKAQPKAEEGPSAAEYPPPELQGYLQQAERGLSARQFWLALQGPPPVEEELPVPEEQQEAPWWPNAFSDGSVMGSA